jgi:hypothetical protein
MNKLSGIFYHLKGAKIKRRCQLKKSKEIKEEFST